MIFDIFPLDRTDLRCSELFLKAISRAKKSASKVKVIFLETLDKLANVAKEAHSAELQYKNLMSHQGEGDYCLLKTNPGYRSKILTRNIKIKRSPKNYACTYHVCVEHDIINT